MIEDILKDQPKGERITIDFLLDKRKIGEDCYQNFNVDALCRCLLTIFDCDIYPGDRLLIRIKGLK